MTKKKSDSRALKPGDILSETQYYTVTSNDAGGVGVRNERGFEFNIAPKIVEEGSYSAHQYTDEKVISRSEVVDLLRHAGDTVFEVCFKKQIEAKELKEIINDPNVTVKSQKAAKELVLGEERVLRGYLAPYGREEFGRFQVIDLEQAGDPEADFDPRKRLVDQKTIQYLILRNVKYTVK